MRALIIDPRHENGAKLREFFGYRGVIADHAIEGDDAVSIAKTTEYDVIVMEYDLQTQRWLRDANLKTPIVVYGDIGVAERVKALSIGADDAMSEPISRDELLSRVQAVVRRNRGHVRQQITVGQVMVDMDGKAVFFDGAPVKLTGKEYSVVELLAMRKNKILSKEQILSHLYGGLDEPETTKIIDVFICNLRKKIPDHIHTSWGRGYGMFESGYLEAAA